MAAPAKAAGAGAAVDIEKLINETDDGDLVQKVLDSNRYLYYIMLQSSMGSASAEDLVVTDEMPWWQTALIAVDVVCCALAAVCVVMFVLQAACFFEGQYTEGFMHIVDPACLDIYCCKDGSMYGSFSGPDTSVGSGLSYVYGYWYSTPATALTSPRSPRRLSAPTAPASPSGTDASCTAAMIPPPPARRP